MRRCSFTHSDIGWANGIVESLGRHRRKKAKTVLALLEGQYGDEDPALMDWLRPCFADLAGEMWLEEAVPLLMEYVGHESDLNMADAADRALQRIGGEIVVCGRSTPDGGTPTISSSAVQQPASSATFAATFLSSVVSTFSMGKKTTKRS